MMKTTSIKATSRASVKIEDSFYTVEYAEERTTSDNLTDAELQLERDDLWTVCNTEVDNQVKEILETFSKKR